MFSLTLVKQSVKIVQPFLQRTFTVCFSMLWSGISGCLTAFIPLGARYVYGHKQVSPLIQLVGTTSILETGKGTYDQTYLMVANTAES